MVTLQDRKRGRNAGLEQGPAGTNARLKAIRQKRQLAEEKICDDGRPYTGCD